MTQKQGYARFAARAVSGRTQISTHQRPFQSHVGQPVDVRFWG